MSSTIERAEQRFWDETERYLGSGERRENEHDRFWRETERSLESLDMERAADRVEEASTGWEDWRGFPLEGFESPRFLSEREREYKRWYRGSSSEAERARHARGD